MSFSRLETSKSRLNIDWCGAGPVHDEQIVDAEGLIRSIAGDDGKPLMILRRSKQADKRIQKLLDAALKSERFQLAARWFNCIQVDDAVLEKDHAYHLLFKGANPPALLLASPDGKKIEDFLGTKADKINWNDISSVLTASYKGNPTKAVKGLERLLSKFDALDNKRKELNAQIERCNEKQDAAKLKKLKVKMEEQEKERQEVLAEEKELRELVLRSQKKADKEKAEKTGG